MIDVTKNKLIHGDCLEVMPHIPNESLPLTITSPPYFVKKSYEKDWTWEKFNELMKNIFINLYEKTKPGGYFVINFGDNAFGRDMYNTECISTYPMTSYYWEIKYKWELQATRIWRKIFARIPYNGQAKVAPRNLFDYEHIWTFRKSDGTGKEKVRDRKLSCRGVLGENWTSKALGKHRAAFPIELPTWAIMVYSDKNDMVFDPFMGSGTTAVACLETNRKFLGTELNKEYYDIAKERINKWYQNE